MSYEYSMQKIPSIPVDSSDEDDFFDDFNPFDVEPPAGVRASVWVRDLKVPCGSNQHKPSQTKLCCHAVASG